MSNQNAPITGATYKLPDGTLCMCTGTVIRESIIDDEDGLEYTKYARVTDGVERCMPTTEFLQQTELAVPAQPSIGLPAVAYLWTNGDGMRIATIDPEEFSNERDYPGVTREALVRLSDAHGKWSIERIQYLSLKLKIEGTIVE